LPGGEGEAQREIRWAAVTNVVLAIDIKVAGDGSGVPDNGQHPVIQICCIVGKAGRDEPDSQTVFTWRPTAAIAGVHLVVEGDEVAMLGRFSAFVVQMDPDVITGYNVCAFDLKYLIQRMQKLQLSSALCVGRQQGSPMCFVWRRAADKVFRYKDGSYGQGAEVYIPGRVVHDVLQWVTNQHQLDATDGVGAYSLENCARIFLKDSKGSLKWQQIVPMFNGSDTDRSALAVYCLKDAHFALRLMNLLSKNCPEVQPFFEVADAPSPQVAVLPALSHSPVNAVTGHVVTPASSSLPPAVLARIEANKQAAMQRRKAAENAASLQLHGEGCFDPGANQQHPSAANQQHPSAATVAAEVVKVSVKRHWGTLGAVSDDCDD
jgi:hypothetical protein